MKEWYLEHTPPELTSGYESDALVNYRESNFADVLYTDIAETVTLYNHDMSESKKIRCIIQGNTSDTQLKSLERIFLFEIGTVKAGMYIFFENRYWLIDGYPGNNGIYEKATSVLCQYNLRWQDENGNILERWCNITSASKYDVGEGGNNTIILTSNNYSIKIAYDEDVMKLEGKRVFIDRNKIPTKVFKITRNDDVLYNYGDTEHGSILNFIADKQELNPETDNQDLRICDYQQYNKIATEIGAIIISGSDTLRIGRKKTWNIITDERQLDLSNYTWNIDSDFQVTSTVDTMSISLLIQDIQMIGRSFTLQVLNQDNIVVASKEILIKEGF